MKKHLFFSLFIIISFLSCKKNTETNDSTGQDSIAPEAVPTLYLTTAAPVLSKEDYITGTLMISASREFGQEEQNITLEIKGRGNSTWAMPKKPYRLKFGSKASVLGIPAAKNWVLLANYSDKTLMRNRIAFELGRKISADFTPESRFVEVVMNGEYLGNYLLTSQVEVGENRVNITELNKGKSPDDDISGGYLVELEQRDIEAPSFKTNKNLSFNIKSPDDITQDQLTYLQTYFQQTEDALFSAQFADPEAGYAKYINTDSFISWYLVQELMKNNDALDWTSIFLYKDKNGKLGMGPLWDFDIAAGNNDYSEARYPTGWYIKNSVWFSRLFQDDSFRKKVKKKWMEIKDKELAEVISSIDTDAEYLQLSQQKNFSTWPILDQYVWPNQFVLGTYAAETAQLKSWLNERINWMDVEINQY